MISIVYPWKQGGRISIKEITMSMRSLCKYEGRYQVVVIGDAPPGLAEIIYIPHASEPTPRLPRCLDANRKMRLAFDCPHITEDFVVMHDDMVLLEPITELMLRQRHYVQDFAHMPQQYRGSQGSSLQHHEMLWATHAALKAAGMEQVYNYETHMPRLYNKRLMGQVFERFRPEENRLLYATLYYNWTRHLDPVNCDAGRPLSKLDTALASFHRKVGDPISFPPAPTADRHAAMVYYLKCMLGKRFANWSPKGLERALVDVLIQLYPNKCAHELGVNVFVYEPKAA